ncbi:MAG: hypothetical protein ACREE6_17255, partial [Limisphaerales bacterium]
VAARSNLIVIPGIMALGVQLIWPGTSPLWLFAGISATIGAVAGTLFLDHEVYPRISTPDLLRQAAFGWLMRFLIWIIFITAAVAMPYEFNLTALGVGLVVVIIVGSMGARRADLDRTDNRLLCAGPGKIAWNCNEGFPSDEYSVPACSFNPILILSGLRVSQYSRAFIHGTPAGSVSR